MCVCDMLCMCACVCVCVCDEHNTWLRRFVSASVTGPRLGVRPSTIMIDITPSIITNDYQRLDPVPIVVNQVVYCTQHSYNL